MRKLLPTAVIASVGLLVVWLPLWPFGAARTVVVLAAAALVTVALAWRVRRFPDPAVVLLLVFWLVMAVMAPVWSAWDETGRVVAAEARGLAEAAAVSMGFVAVTYRTPWGLQAWRWLWVAVLLTTIPAGLWEFATGRNLTDDPFFGPTGQPGAAFGNPNNFTCVLLLGVGLCLWEVFADPRPLRLLAFGALGAATAVMIVLAGSRAGIFLLTVTAITFGIHTLARERRARRGRGLSLFAVAVLFSPFVGGALLVLAPSFPLLSRLTDIFTAADRGSDEYRLRLLAHGWRFWRQDPLTGIGGGRYESALRQAWPQNREIPHLHNAALELLTEYGLVPSLIIAALGVVLLSRLFRRPVADGALPAGHHDTRPLLAATLLALDYGIVVVDSALAMPPWWVMLATAVTLASPRSSVPRAARTAAAQ